MVVTSQKKGDLSDEPSYYACSHRGWRASTVLGPYSRRWEVEEFYRDAKQHLGLGDCQIRSAIGIGRHWYLVLLMNSLLRLWGCERGPMRGSGEGGTVTLGDCQRALRNEVLYDLLAFVISRLLGEAGTLSVQKQQMLLELIRELVG